MEGDLLSDEEELREQSEDLDLNQHRYIKRAAGQHGKVGYS
jgi:hypothetical protein